MEKFVIVGSKRTQNGYDVLSPAQSHEETLVTIRNLESTSMRQYGPFEVISVEEAKRRNLTGI